MMQAAKGKTEDSIDTKLFKVLKEIGVELSSYHGGSLNGNDIKKVINNAGHIFDKLVVIMKEGKRPDTILSDADVNELCGHFCEVFILWDGAFSLAQTVNPMENDTKTFLHYVSAAVHGNNDLRCTVTPALPRVDKSKATIKVKIFEFFSCNKSTCYLEHAPKK